MNNREEAKELMRLVQEGTLDLVEANAEKVAKQKPIMLLRSSGFDEVMSDYRIEIGKADNAIKSAYATVEKAAEKAYRDRDVRKNYVLRENYASIAYEWALLMLYNALEAAKYTGAMLRTVQAKKIKMASDGSEA